MCLRTSAGSLTDAGVSSMSFWLRRWMEQSRSCRCSTLPYWSAIRLHFDVGRTMEITLVEEAGVGEGGLGGFAGAFDDGFQLRHAMHHVDADAAAAGGSLDHHGEAQLPGAGDSLFVLDGFLGARHDGQARLAGYPAGGQLVAHLVQHFLAGADEGDAVGLAAAGQLAVFGQEPVTGMDGLGAGIAAGVQHGVDVEVGIRRRRPADANRLVGHPGMEGAGVGFGIDGDGGDAQALTGSYDAGGNLAPVGNQYLVEHDAPH